MSRLARAVEKSSSGDIIHSRGIFEKKDRLEERIEAEKGSVKSSLDLSLFKKFDAASRKIRKRANRVIIYKGGIIALSKAVTEKFPVGSSVEFLLNKKGNILVIRRAENGIALRNEDRPVVNCAALKNELLGKGYKIPVTYKIEWDEELDGWVGRLEEGK